MKYRQTDGWTDKVIAIYTTKMNFICGEYERISQHKQNENNNSVHTGIAVLPTWYCWRCVGIVASSPKNTKAQTVTTITKQSIWKGGRGIGQTNTRGRGDNSFFCCTKQGSVGGGAISVLRHVNYLILF